MKTSHLLTAIIILTTSHLTTLLVMGQTPAPTFDRGSCPPIQLSDLGSTDILSTSGLLPEALRERLGSVSGPRPAVRVFDFHVVCEAAGRTRETVGSVSLVVNFECLGEACQGSGLDVPPLVNLTEQIQLNCTLEFLEGGFVGFDNYETGVFSGTLRTMNPITTFDTPTDDQCGFCVDPFTGVQSDIETHCVSCSEACTEGQRRCIGPGSDQCCNWYFNNDCVVTCPTPLVGDPQTFDCGCPELFLENGEISYTDRFLPGSVARYACQDGFELSPPCNSTRMCTNSGWTNVDYTCQSIQVPTEPDTVTLPPSTSNSDNMLVVVTTALSLLCLLLFLLGLSLGACIHNYCSHRSRVMKEKKDMYVVEEPPVAVVKVMEDDIERAIHTASGEGNKAVVGQATRASADMANVLELSDNGSHVRLLSTVGRRQEEMEAMDDNYYVSDPMENVDRPDDSTSKTDAPDNHDTVPSGIEGATENGGIDLEDNVAYVSHDVQETSHKVEDYEHTVNDSTIAEQEAIELETNAAYVSNTQLSEGGGASQTDAEVHTTSVGRTADIQLEENVAYKTHEYEDCTSRASEDEPVYSNPQQSQISVEKNSAYNYNHVPLKRESGSGGTARQYSDRSSHPVAARRKGVQGEHSVMSNGGTMSAINDAEGIESGTSHGDNDHIQMMANIAYLTHQRKPQTSSADNFPKHTQNSHIPTSENIAYATSLRPDHSQFAVSGNSTCTGGGGGLALWGNGGRGSHGGALSTVGEEEEENEGDYVIN